ncbi:MAG: ABC transporter permease [bacterium]
MARIIKFSLQDIFRNIWLSLVTIIILILALFTVNMLMVVKILGQTAVDAVKEKIDINLFLKSEAGEDEIQALRANISNLKEVKEVQYISRTEALQEFTVKHKDNQEIMEALKEIGKNPLAPRLVIKPKNLDTFDDLINQLGAINSNIIESRNFADYKTMIEKINVITNKVSEAGFGLSFIFIFTMVLVIYNSVRVAIYTHRKEIIIMRLVGASNWFIQTPYLFSSLAYTLIGVCGIMAIFYPFLSLLQPYLETFFVGYSVDLFDYYYSSMFKIFGLQFVCAATINIIASYLAVRKYARK